MTTAEATLWENIQNFELDNNRHDLQFSDRLARENGWTKEFTLRVIEEYRRFLFLCCISPTGVTPSDAVDQAWHLHLTYTKSYWIDLCRNTLGQDIHHNPTEGGNAEANKFDSFYTDSFNLYADKFSHTPPEDIWPSNEKRFSDINFRRVNLSEHVPVKRWVIIALKIIGMLIAAVIGLIILPTVYNGFDTTTCAFGLLILGAAVFGNSYGIKKRENGGSCGGDGGCGGDSDPGHHSGGHDGGHGCSSGCSGCSGSGCSGCGGGGD